jgi:hypothetical protein
LANAGVKFSLLEVEITYIIGSGDHARQLSASLLNGRGDRASSHLLHTGESLGHESRIPPPRHLGFGRQIDCACMFCHDALAKLGAGAGRYGSIARFP